MKLPCGCRMCPSNSDEFHGTSIVPSYRNTIRNVRLLCSIYYRTTIFKPYLVTLGAWPFFLSYSGLLRVWPKGLDPLAGISGKQVDKDQSGRN